MKMMKKNKKGDEGQLRSSLLKIQTRRPKDVTHVLFSDYNK